MTPSVNTVSSPQAVERDVDSHFAGFEDVAPSDLKRRATHGALISTVAQGANFVLRTGSMMILARLLAPQDFGLVGMVTAFTGFLSLFRDAGLSMVTVQREKITRQETSTLFWINLLIGIVLASLAALAAPLLVSFYHEPRLFWVTIILGTSFIFNGVGTQHRALLQRTMRFGMIAGVDITALCLSISVAVGMAACGLGWQSLVGMTVSLPAFSAAGLWLSTRWVPGPPRRDCGIRSMLLFGGTVTVNSVVSYLTYNADKVLLGRFMGAEVLGIYGRAYQLINLPTENLNSSLSMVALPALSRVQNDPERLRSYFLKGYGLFLAIVLPITMGCGLFADDIIRFFLGPKWEGAAPIFRLMAPTIVAFALINPFGWLLLATGRTVRSLKISLAIAPVIVLSYVFGLRHGAGGVAAGFSTAMVAVVIPVILWAKRETHITTLDVIGTTTKPLISILIAAGVAWVAESWTGLVGVTVLRLFAECGVLFGVYAGILVFAFGQKRVYLDLLKTTGIWPGAGRWKERSVGR